jgi:hypothetical protein
MKQPSFFAFSAFRTSWKRQSGVVLFITLIALLAMSLAAVALIRSVDTGTLIAGNLAFKQSATSSADAGIERALDWLAGVEAANLNGNVLMDPIHPFNLDDAANGYYSGLASINLDTFDWDANGISVIDGSGNDVRYVIERMCRISNNIAAASDCIYSGGLEDGNGRSTPLSTTYCDPKLQCPGAGSTPMIRITVRSRGAKSTISFVQAFAF